MRKKIVRAANPFIALASITKGLLLNVLGAGGIWALKGVIESYANDSNDLGLDKVFRPLYYTTISGLTLWQLLEYTAFTSKAFAEEMKVAETPSDSAVLANKYPVLYLYQSMKSFSCGCSCLAKMNDTDENCSQESNEQKVEAGLSI